MDTTLNPATSSKPSTFNTVLSAGLAMFSMFFGAGNVVFPLALGQYAQNKTPFAIAGLLITAVGVPLAGVIGMTLFNGDYKSFFARAGKIPGFLITTIIISLLGPFGAIPRCIALSFSTIKMYLPEISLSVFSMISCLLIFLFTFKKNRILDILGYILTPFLLISLGIIIVKGLFTSSIMPIAEYSNTASFIHGLNEGYQTMDLLGAFFFSGIVIACLKKNTLSLAPDKDYKQLTRITVQAGSIGASLLALIYIGFSYVAAFHSENLGYHPQDELLGELSRQILGPSAGIIASITVALACLTTAIALTAVFADFLLKEICKEKINYTISLITTLLTAFFISTLNFTGIIQFLGPILQICYPSLIAFTLFNITYKLFQFEPVKVPVMIVFIISLMSYYLL